MLPVRCLGPTDHISNEVGRPRGARKTPRTSTSIETGDRDVPCSTQLDLQTPDPPMVHRSFEGHQATGQAPGTRTKSLQWNQAPGTKPQEQATPQIRTVRPPNKRMQTDKPLSHGLLLRLRGRRKSEDEDRPRQCRIAQQPVGHPAPLRSAGPGLPLMRIPFDGPKDQRYAHRRSDQVPGTGSGTCFAALRQPPNSRKGHRAGPRESPQECRRDVRAVSAAPRSPACRWRWPEQVPAICNL
jgi:hypothetical protein